jgi:predicted glycosyltransferase involved in capsule biosynthesis
MVSIIISFKQSDNDRGRNLRMLLPYLNNLALDKEIIVVEQDSESKMGWLAEMRESKTIRHIFIRNGGIFNKGAGYNVGVRESRGEYLMFSDVDLFMKPAAYLNMLPPLSAGSVVKPYTDLYYLNKTDSNVFLDHGCDMNIMFREGIVAKHIRPTVISGGIFAIGKETFFTLNGFDESCAGYGYEDDILDTKIRRTGLDVKNINDYCIHLYHDSIRDGLNKGDEYYSRFEQNKKLFHWYTQVPLDELMKTVKNASSWGETEYEYITH